MQGKSEIGLRKPRIEPVIEHCSGTVYRLFSRLTDQDDRPRPLIVMSRQPSGRTNEAGHVHVVTTGVHYTDIAAGTVACLDFAGIRETGFFHDRQRVHISADQHDWTFAIFQDPDHSELAHARRHFRPCFFEFFGDPLGGLDFLTRKLRVSMEMRVESHQIIELRAQPRVAGTRCLGVCRARRECEFAAACVGRRHTHEQ